MPRGGRRRGRLAAYRKARYAQSPCGVLPISHAVIVRLLDPGGNSTRLSHTTTHKWPVSAMPPDQISLRCDLRA